MQSNSLTLPPANTFVDMTSKYNQHNPPPATAQAKESGNTASDEAFQLEGDASYDDDDDDEKSLAAALEMPHPVNNGKWTIEEVEYMLALMEAFKAGYVPVKKGTSLRIFLSKMLSCKPVSFSSPSLFVSRINCNDGFLPSLIK